MSEHFAKGADAAPSDRASTFRFYVPVHTFEKAGAPEGKRRRIAGIATTDSLDRQGEIVLQDRLDWSFFKQAGVLNDNHGRGIDDVIGYPEEVVRFSKGDRLPDGSVAPANGHWLEGCLLEGDPKADRIWQKARLLEQSAAPRKLAFSIEGDVLARSGPGGKTVAAALIRNTAVTHAPVNPDSGLYTLVKSLESFEQSMQPEASTEVRTLTVDELDRALTAGSVSGAAIQPQDLEGVPSPFDAKPCSPRCESKACKGCQAVKKSLSKAEGVYWLGVRYPHMTFKSLEKLYDTAARISRETSRPTRP